MSIHIYSFNSQSAPAMKKKGADFTVVDRKKKGRNLQRGMRAINKPREELG